MLVPQSLTPQDVSSMQASLYNTTFFGVDAGNNSSLPQLQLHDISQVDLDLQVLDSPLFWSTWLQETLTGFYIPCLENTQVTCHVGVPSCGQRHRNVFIALLLTCTITNTIINDSLASPPCASSPASSHRHREPVTRPHIRAQAQNPTWIRLHGANPTDTRCKFSCDDEFIISSNTSKVSCHFILSSMPHPFPSTSLSSVPLRPIEDYTS